MQIDFVREFRKSVWDLASVTLDVFLSRLSGALASLFTPGRSKIFILLKEGERTKLTADARSKVNLVFKCVCLFRPEVA